MMLLMRANKVCLRFKGGVVTVCVCATVERVFFGGCTFVFPTQCGDDATELQVYFCPIQFGRQLKALHLFGEGFG